MTLRELTAPVASVGAVAKLFEGGQVCLLSAREDRAFGTGRHLALGEIELFPSGADDEHRSQAVKLGEFEWRTPTTDEVLDDLRSALGVDTLDDKARAKADDKLRRISDSVGGAAIRLGLAHPILDPVALERMPFKRPTTIISDTSGVIQGGLSFAARFLHPAGRIKVPAVVQMEIVNFSDRFLSNRRATKVRAVDLLMDHLNSQAGQRVLLQLELRSAVEVERTYLLGDPLRGAFQPEQDGDLKELNLSVAIRSYADRLILEAARQHQSQVSHGHPVMLLTSDQGLARMAMAEGLSPLYFRAAKAGSLFGRTLTGVNFHPFTGALCFRSLPDILWEIATIFGSARLTTRDGTAGLEVCAIGGDLAWSPYHAHDDLLWVNDLNGDAEKAVEARNAAAIPAARKGEPPAATTGTAAAVAAPARRARAPGPELPLYKMSLERLFKLVEALDAEQNLPEERVVAVLGIAAPATGDYRRFLESGNAVRIDGGGWKAGPSLKPLSVAIRNADAAEIGRSFEAFPSYIALRSKIAETAIGVPVDVASFGRAASTFTALAEITALGASVHGRGFFPASVMPDDEEFVQIALSAYDRLKKEGGWVETGVWLEELVVAHGVHPLVARSRLQDVSERGLLRRITEGSTTDTKLDRHMLRTVQFRDGTPMIKTEHLYRGDFLIPGKGSSSLRIERIAA